MADGFNRCSVLGNLGSDPVLKNTQSSSVLTLSIACNESYLDRNRVRQERVEWIRVTIWGKRAEALAKFLRKGASVYAEGPMRTRSYEDREGIKRYTTEIAATNIIVNGGAKARNPPNDPERRRPSRRDDEDEGSHDTGAPDAQSRDDGWGDNAPDSDIPF